MECEADVNIKKRHLATLRERSETEAPSTKEGSGMNSLAPEGAPRAPTCHYLLIHTPMHHHGAPDTGTLGLKDNTTFPCPSTNQE